MDFASILEQVRTELDEAGYPFALIGGLGLAALGIARATLDLDLLVPAQAQSVVVALMEGLGYETLHLSSGYSNHLHADEMLGRVDFVYVRGDTSTQIFADARELEGPGGTVVLVPRPEHLAAMKVHAMKNDPTRGPQDLADIGRLLAVPGVDAEAIRAAFERHGMLRFWRDLEPKTSAD
jgi:hypothetical protein